jgi:hypothetical protein
MKSTESVCYRLWRKLNIYLAMNQECLISIQDCESNEWHLAATNDKQQTTSDKQQTTNNKQQTTSDKQQATNNKRQTTSDKQQTYQMDG